MPWPGLRAPGPAACGSRANLREFTAVRGVGFEPVGQVFGAAVFAAGYASGYSCPGAWGSSADRRPARAGHPGVRAARCGVVRAAGGGHVPGPADGHRPDGRRMRRAGRARSGRRPAVPGGATPQRARFRGHRHRSSRAGCGVRTGSGRSLPAISPGRISPSCLQRGECRPALRSASRSGHGTMTAAGRPGALVVRQCRGGRLDRAGEPSRHDARRRLRTRRQTARRRGRGDHRDAGLRVRSGTARPRWAAVTTSRRSRSPAPPSPGSPGPPRVRPARP